MRTVWVRKATVLYVASPRSWVNDASEPPSERSTCRSPPKDETRPSILSPAPAKAETRVLSTSGGLTRSLSRLSQIEKTCLARRERSRDQRTPARGLSQLSPAI